MTEFQDIDDFIKDLENPEYKAYCELTIGCDADKLREKDEEATREELREFAAKEMSKSEIKPEQVKLVHRKGLRLSDFE